MLHSQTTLMLAALLFLVLPVLMWWATAGQRSAAMAWWCAGSLLVSLGIILMGARPWLLTWLGYHAANTCLMTGMVFWAQSMRLMDHRGWPLGWMGVALALAALYYSLLFEFWAPHERGMGVRWMLGTLALYTAWLAWQQGRRQKSYNATAIAVCYLLLGLGMWAQMMQSGIGMDPSPFSNSWDASVIAVLAVITSAIGHFCFTGMVLDASIQSQLQAQRARAGAEESVRLATHLRLLDRQDRMRWISASMAQELNDPLSTALMQAQQAQYALRTGQAEPTMLARLLERVAADMRKASGILERIRSSARAHSAMRLEQLDLREVLQATMGLLQPEWRHKGVQVDLTLQDKPLWCEGDEVALSQLLMNLLRNATQAVQAGPHRCLEVQAQVREGELTVVIRDHGPGLPITVLNAGDRPHADSPTQALATTTGLGMGLSISRAIAQQHGGHLVLRNHPQGGAEVVLVLPRAAKGMA